MTTNPTAWSEVAEKIEALALKDLRDAATSLADAVVTSFHAIKARVDT